MVSRSWVDIDLSAIKANVAALRSVAPTAELCAVLKADGYGHGALAAGQAAIDAGASKLAVAQVDEGIALRAGGLTAPVWVLSEPEPAELPATAEAELEPAVYTERGVEAAIALNGPLTVHLKVDTGMHRVGADPGDVVAFAKRIVASRSLRLGSIWTHLASADDDGERIDDVASMDRSFTDRQLDRYDAVLAEVAAAGIEVPLRHAANSAGTIAHPRSHFDVVRCGIALYGVPPSPGLADRVPLRAALEWRSTISMVKRLRPGDAVSYGQRRAVAAETTVATVPVGYADGYRRALWERGPGVLIRGVRRPVLGVVTMDQLVVDCGDDPVEPGDEVVLIGHQSGLDGGAEAAVSAGDLAAALGTIGYEIPVSIGRRVERRYRER